MKIKWNFKHWFLLFVFVLSSCVSPAAQQTPTPEPTPTPTLPSPTVRTTRVPSPEDAARTFLDAWKAEKYDQMYDLLAKANRDSISAKDFDLRYRDTAINLTLQKIEYEILSALVDSPSAAQVAYRVTYTTSLMGDIKRDMVMDLALVDGKWLVKWQDSMIMPELRDGNRLALEYKVPARGNIYDRNGEAIATLTDAWAAGVVKGEIGSDEAESSLISILGRMTGKAPEQIKAMYEGAAPSWYVPIGEISASEMTANFGDLSKLGGLILNKFRARFYFGNGIAPQVTGYVQAIPKERLEEYRRLGYRGDEKVGMAGLEKWGETYLAGQKGASLFVTNPQGQIVTRLTQSESKPAQNLYTTIDQNLQVEAQKAIQSFRGAIVVLERDTGRVLAMVSSPNFDPNLFEPSNYNSVNLSKMLSDGQSRLLNRAAQGSGYPLGSVFKIITMSAALESGLYTAESSMECGHTFNELPNLTFYDWTYEKKYKASGKLTLPEGLMRSCNPWFYHIGLDLYRQNRETAISDMARAFGLGSATGIEEIGETAGNVPNPATEVDAIQLAIGQSTLQVTPLQVARFAAAMGNGGRLLRPQVVEKITTPDGVATYNFAVEEQGKLPLKPENMEIVQKAMRSVIDNPRGTAYYAFTGLSIPIYGKTGTAQAGEGLDPHAWFAGYTDLRKADKPDIAVAVIAENSGEGSEIAAPIFRRVVELYFFGRAEKLYPWEAGKFNVTRTPTLPVTATPSPTPENQ